jgi:hypothetical protein
LPDRRYCSGIDLQRRDERLLRDVDLAELPHFLFALLLLVEQFAFAGGVAAVALGRHVLAHGAHGFTRDTETGLRVPLPALHLRREPLLAPPENVTRDDGLGEESLLRSIFI